MQSVIPTKRPRNVNAFQAAAILYGDWGTSKAYVLGLAFMVAGYSSFWIIALASLLNILVALNYIIVCKYYPNGGGVYASVRHRSEILAMVGGFFLVADYIVTATLSALAAFQYLGVEHPVAWAAGIIAFIGALNYFGPKHTGNLALILCIAAIIVVFSLGLLSIPYLNTAIHHVQPMTGGWRINWIDFVSIIVALSGIEAIANTTGVMKLNPGSTEAKPSVTKTSTPAILAVMFEVCIFTTLFGLAMNALPGLVTNGTEVNAPDFPNVRDAMLRYMGQVFAGNLFGPQIGYICGLIVSIIFCLLLLSAVNTAIVALVSLIYVMSRDGELPKKFQSLNYYGVPKLPLLIATIIPIILLYNVGTVAGLANLYAVGFVGAIATNLGSTSTDKSLNLSARERIMMFLTFCILAAVEITLFIEKPDARSFVISVLAAGLLLRGLVLERNKRAPPLKKVTSGYSIDADVAVSHIHTGAMLCAVTHLGKTLEFAIQECKKHNQMLYILFVRVKPVITEIDLTRTWLDDEAACKIFDYAKDQVQDVSMKFLYVVSDAPTQTIVETAKKLHISRVILGMPRIAPLVQMIHGNVVRDIGRLLPEDIDLVVIC
jgi:amino acid transporter